MATAATEAAYTGEATAAVGPLEQTIMETDRRRSIRNTAAQELGVPAGKVCELLRHVWRTSKDQAPLTDQEMFAGMSLIARFGLDPIAREVYVTRESKGRLLTIVGIDGWIKILDRTDHYDGFEQELHFDDEETKLIWAETRIFSTKRKRPIVYRAFMEEYRQFGGFVAKQAPWHMLRLFSLRHAARLFVPLGGAVTEQEAHWMTAAERMPEARTPAENGSSVTAGDLLRQDTPASTSGVPTEPSTDAATREALEDALARLDAATLIGDVKAIVAEFEARDDLPGHCREKICKVGQARMAQIRSSRGSRSNKKAEDVDPAVAASEEQRDKWLAQLKSSTDQATINIENAAIEAKSTGDLLPLHCEEVTTACRRRFAELAGAEV